MIVFLCTAWHSSTADYVFFFFLSFSFSESSLKNGTSVEKLVLLLLLRDVEHSPGGEDKEEREWMGRAGRRDTRGGGAPKCAVNRARSQEGRSICKCFKIRCRSRLQRR